MPAQYCGIGNLSTARCATSNEVVDHGNKHPVVARLPSHLGEPRQYDRQQVKIALHHTSVESHGERRIAFEPREVSAQDRASTELALFAMGAAQMCVRGWQVAFRK
jgi:hypothetical protein